MQIRPADVDDLGSLRSLLGELGYTPPADAVRAGLRAPGTSVLVAVDGDSVVGLVVLTCRGVFHRGAVVGTVDTLVVGEAHRSRGVGSALLQAAAAEAEREGAVLLELDSNVSRVEARRFYERSGFEVTSNHFRRPLRSDAGGAPVRTAERRLPGGLVLRAARDTDVEQVASLVAARGDAADAVDARLMLDDPDQGLDACAVVLDGDRVVSTACLLDETLVLDGVELPVGQVDLVATASGYEGRGLVRSLMGWAHERSSLREGTSRS